MMAAGRAGLGVALVVAATGLFALADSIGKHLAAGHAVALIILVRSLVAMALLGAVLGPSQGRRLWALRRKGLVVLRSLCLAAASVMMIEALKRMPLGETVAIIYLQPFLVMLLARPVLGERVSAAGWVGTCLAFAGVLMIVRPGSGLEAAGVTLAVGTAIVSAGFQLLTRVLSATETSGAMTFNTALVAAVVAGALVAADPPAALPGLPALGLMACIGVLATAGHFLYASAYREAEASVLAPVNYAHVVWATVLGALIFGHRPDGPTLAGMALIIAGGAIGAWRRRARVAEEAPPAV